MMSDGVGIRWLGRLAQLIYRQAAAITVISPGFKRYLIARGVPAEKIHVIPNWANEEVYQPLPRDFSLGERYRLSGRFNVMFAGNMGPAQALHIVLQTATLLQDTSEIQFVFIGDGIELPKLKEETEQQNLRNVQFIERQPDAVMPHFFAWADALLVQLRNDPLFHITIPSKTLAYVACGRPILCAVPGDGADVVRRAGAGLICPPEDPQALAQAVRALYAISPAEREAMGQAGRKAFLQTYTRRVLVDRYETLFQDVTRYSR
jgi:putative colanic acid biosynthesis glycosyltransferase WcaI